MDPETPKAADTTSDSAMRLIAGKYKLLYESGEVSAARTWDEYQSSRIYIDNHENGEYANWEITPARDAKWHIRNIGVGDVLFGEPIPNTRIIGRVDRQRETAWGIEPTGDDTYRIEYPGRGLFWTAISSPVQIPGRVAWEIFLEHGISGASQQQFRFVRIGD